MSYVDDAREDQVKIVYRGADNTESEYYEMHLLLEEVGDISSSEAVVFKDLRDADGISNFTMIQDYKGSLIEDIVASHYTAYAACIASGFDSVRSQYSKTNTSSWSGDILLFVHLLGHAFSRSGTPRRFIHDCQEYIDLDPFVIEAVFE